MKERVGKNIKRVIIIAAAALLALCMAGIIMVWAADGVEIEDPSTAKFTDSAFDQYHDSEAESILGPVGSFHLVAFDTLHINAHCNGNFATNDLQANSNNGTNNYGSEVSYAKKFTSGNPGAGGDDIFVVGNNNSISTTDGGSAITVNDKKLDNTKHIIKSNDFIDLADWKAKTQAVSNNYKSHSTSDSVTTDFSDRNNQKITVKKGGSFLNLTATSNGLNGIASDTPLRIDVGSGNNVVINVDCSKVPANGTLSLPNCKTILKGQELNNREVTKFNENYITWNFTNIPSGMTIDANLMIGSILAPGATVNLNQNLNGTCAADTIYVKAESHRDDSRGTTPNTPTAEKGSLKLTKTFNGIDDASKIDLSKIKFEVKGIDSKTSSIDKKDISLTNNNGTYSAKIENLPLGEYEVTETNADISGYKLKTTYRVGSTETQKVSLTSSDNDATVDITNDYTKKVDTGSLIFTKRTLGDAQTPDSTQFTIKGPNDNVVYQGTYSELKKTNGSVTIDNLPVGEYKVTENVDSAKVNGYTLSVKGNNSVTKVETNKTATDTITNTYSQDKGKLTFTKTFDGYNVTDQDKNNITFTVKDKDGNVVTEVSLGKMTKGSDGKYTYTVENLTPGDYTVTENHADSMTGYNFVQKDSVTSGKTTVTSDNTSTIDLSDVYTQKKGTLTFTKTFGGDVTKADLSNITFTITGPKGFTPQTVKLSGMTKGNDGKYTYTLDNLEWGTYTVKETNSSVNGYTLDKTSHIEGDVTVDATHLEGDANTINLTDNYSPVHPRVQLFKNEFYNGGLTGNPVGGASYALYRWKGSKASLQLFTMLTRASVDPATETDWSKVTRSDIMNSDNWEYLGEDNTDGTGFVCSKDELNEGDIVAALEVTAPAGYQRTANPAILQVHVNKAATLISDSDGAVSLDKDGNLQWKETVVRIGIKKVDANGNAVVGAKMAVLDKDGKVIDTWTTTKDNLVHETDKLIAGETYTLRELQAPEGYEKAADVTFTAEAKDIKGTDEYVQSVTMIDQKSQPAKPGTPSKGTTVKPAQTVAQGVKTGDPTTIGGLVLMFAAAGAVLVLSAKHLKAMR